MIGGATFFCPPLDLQVEQRFPEQGHVCLCLSVASGRGGVYIAVCFAMNRGGVHVALRYCRTKQTKMSCVQTAVVPGFNSVHTCACSLFGEEGANRFRPKHNSSSPDSRETRKLCSDRAVVGLLATRRPLETFWWELRPRLDALKPVDPSDFSLFPLKCFCGRFTGQKWQ